jgi:hypothetical protein
MSQYSTGTVNVTNDNAVVVGVQTDFVSYVSIGDLFKVQGIPVTYEVAGITDETHLTLAETYKGSTDTGLSYTIHRDFTPMLKIPELSSGDIDIEYFFTKGMRTVDYQVPLAVDFILETETCTKVNLSTFEIVGVDLTSRYAAGRFLYITILAFSFYTKILSSSYGGSPLATTVTIDQNWLSSAIVNVSYGYHEILASDAVKDSHIDFGTGANQVNDADLPVVDASGNFASSNLDGVLDELYNELGYRAGPFVLGEDVSPPNGSRLSSAAFLVE